MGALLINVFEIGLKVAAIHAGGKVEEIAKVSGLIMEMARGVNELSISETGQPIDWNKIKEHKHLDEG